MIVTLPKPGKPTDSPASRLHKVLPALIDIDRVGFVAGRQCRDGTRRIIDLLHMAELSRSPTVFLSLDAEKAFDRVHWGYLERCKMSQAPESDDNLSLPGSSVSGRASNPSLRSWTVPKLVAELNRRGIRHPASARKTEPEGSNDQPSLSSIQLSLLQLQSTIGSLAGSVANIQARMGELESRPPAAPPSPAPPAIPSTSQDTAPGTSRGRPRRYSSSAIQLPPVGLGPLIASAPDLSPAFTSRQHRQEL
ncbi:uncharacterized protein LOC122931592 [Bufo gargarizans]|uniref:uncharacterized protein LOC122931592 n=1 Tax=Bufo gargarizans TaxID=30331 RepID=UPI001CF4BBC5|nr:uncharacterized protein LOC122931592 [Bufo gargarizans]